MRASSTAGSSIVEGTTASLPSAISRIDLRRILPQRVLGSAGTTVTSRNAATGPTSSRTAATSSAASSSGSMSTPALSTTKPRGTWPFIWSATPITAHSATAGCCAITASMTPVDSRCPATLMTSSVRPITNT